MTEENEKLVGVEIKNRFYYVKYPEPVPSTFWLDRAGKLNYISEMSLDHLKHSIQLVEKDLEYLKNSHRPKDVVDVIEPIAKEILTNLREEFKQKSSI